MGGYLDIRVQQRKGNKYITIIEGIPEEYDIKKMLRSWKKVLMIESFKKINIDVFFFLLEFELQWNNCGRKRTRSGATDWRSKSQCG